MHIAVQGSGWKYPISTPGLAWGTDDKLNYELVRSPDQKQIDCWEGDQEGLCISGRKYGLQKCSVFIRYSVFYFDIRKNMI